MFGDIGHGFILFMIGGLMCLFADALKKGPLKGVVEARYLIVMMGFFATFCGICYNDFMAIPVEAGTCYTTQVIGGRNIGV